MMDAKTGRLESHPQTARSVPSEEQTGNTGEVLTDGGARERSTFAPELDGDTFGRAWDRLDEITGVQWEQVFPDGMGEMTPTGFFARMALGRQVTGGTSVHARQTRYEPALDLAVKNGHLEIGEDGEGEPVVRLTGGSVGRGRDR